MGCAANPRLPGADLHRNPADGHGAQPAHHLLRPYGGAGRGHKVRIGPLTGGRSAFGAQMAGLAQAAFVPAVA